LESMPLFVRLTDHFSRFTRIYPIEELFALYFGGIKPMRYALPARSRSVVGFYFTFLSGPASAGGHISPSIHQTGGSFCEASNASIGCCTFSTDTFEKMLPMPKFEPRITTPYSATALSAKKADLTI
jgi:hypothetical protein